MSNYMLLYDHHYVIIQMNVDPEGDLLATNEASCYWWISKSKNPTAMAYECELWRVIGWLVSERMSIAIRNEQDERDSFMYTLINNSQKLVLF